MSPNGRPRVSGLRIMQIVLALVGVGVIAMGVLVGVLFGRVHAQFAAINNERARNVLVACRETNRRHDATIAELDRLLRIRTPHPTPAERRQIAQSRAATVLLIDALTPKRDCAALARRQVDTTP